MKYSLLIAASTAFILTGCWRNNDGCGSCTKQDTTDAMSCNTCSVDTMEHDHSVDKSADQDGMMEEMELEFDDEKK